MAQIYGELIRAQLQVSASDLTSPVVGLVYFNSSTGMKWHTGSAWKVAVDLDSTQELSGKTLNSSCSVDAGSLTIVSLAKGGLGADASGWSGVLKISGGVSEASAILNADIDAAAAIDATKIADGSVDNTAFQKLFTVGTDAAGELVNTDGTQTLTNKTLGTGCSFDPSALPVTPPSKGGTGIANTENATLTRTGDHPVELITSSNTSLILPTSGTLATLDGSETLINKSVSSTAELTGALKLPVGNATTERPAGTAADLKGMIRYNDTDDVFEGYNEIAGWASIGGGGTTDRVTQASHGFVVGDILYLNGSTYTKAIATSAAAAEVVGVVSRIIDASTFEITLSGEVTGITSPVSLTVGEVYFLSAATAGLLTLDEPTVVGQVSVPVGVASSATSLYVAPKRGSVVGSSNVRTQIALSNNATTTVQNIAAYDAGELTGWVSITATTPLRFYVAAQFSKNGAANNYNVSYQVSGDTPPTGFVVTATSGGLLQVTLPSITGFASASINYALNAPAVGTSFPLSVQSSSVVYGSVIETGTGSSTEDVNIKIGSNRTGSGNSYLNLHSQSSVAYSARIVRYSGANGDCSIDNAGTGNLVLTTNGVERFRATTGGIELRNVSGITYVGLGGTGSANAVAFKWTSPNVIARIDNAVDLTLANVSDYRIKREVETQSQPALQRISQLRPVTFKMADYGELFKSSEEIHEGFLAHELQEVIPSSVVGQKDDPDQIQSLNLGALCSVMVKAIQELKEELDAAKEEIAALKGV